MTVTSTRTEHDLKVAISEELEWTPEVTAEHVGVGILDGAVTLSGQVTSNAEKLAAVAAALRVRGVTAVVDEIVVRHPWGAREDADISREAGSALQRCSALSNTSVKAQVHEQVITLSGSASWQYQRLAALHAVVDLPGVREVKNTIALEPAQQVSTVEAQQNILAALQRNAQIDATNITISVNGSVITLSGEVSNWAERHEAEFAAWCTPGVTHVNDRMQLSTVW